VEGEPVTAVRVHNLNLYYGKHHVLRDVSVSVAHGEFVVIIGPNGTGKTSLIKSLAGLLRATGQIEILGKPLSDYTRRQLAKSVAVVPQQAPADFPFTVAETVLMGRSPHLGLLDAESDEDRRIALQAMKFTEVSHVGDRRLDELSGGERQRVIIARAICQQPKLILLDEPTASLDPAHQLRIMALMEKLRREEDITVVMASHDLNLAAMYGSRIFLLRDGRGLLSGSPREIMTPENLQQAYGCSMHVDTHPFTGKPRISLVP
jgi:iron complex transport system ATP-binding protein